MRNLLLTLGLFRIFIMGLLELTKESLIVNEAAFGVF